MDEAQLLCGEEDIPGIPLHVLLAIIHCAVQTSVGADVQLLNQLSAKQGGCHSSPPYKNVVDLAIKLIKNKNAH